MKLTYQTAIATFIQFIAMVVLGVPNALISIITTCQHDGSSCASNMITSIIFFLFTAIWFGFILAVGYFAQKNRSNRLAALLIICEIPTLFVAGLINLPRESNYLAKGTSLVDVILGLIVVYLALRVLFARGRRIVKRSRKTPTNP